MYREAYDIAIDRPKTKQLSNWRWALISKIGNGGILIDHEKIWNSRNKSDGISIQEITLPNPE